MNNLVHYENACKEIALATEIDEAKDWVDKAEALRAYARQAHNADLEIQVAEIKVRALRRMGELSKELEKIETTGPSSVRIPSGGKPKKGQLSDAGISTSAANRAEKIADIPQDEFEAILATHKDNQIPVTQTNIIESRKSTGCFHISKKNNTWNTPQEYIESARQVLGSIDLDPASNESAQEYIKATNYYTEEIDGLNKQWFGNIWLNPPYSMPEIKNFVTKLLESDVESYIVLTNNSSDTTWFHSLLNSSDLICLPKKRVKFESLDGDNELMTRQGQTFFYKGDNKGGFFKEFSKHGAILKTINDYS